MQKEFVISHPMFNQCHASTLLESRGNGADGFLVAYFAGSKEGNNDVSIHLARKITDRWENSGIVAKINDLPHWNPVLFRDPANEQITLFFKVGKNCTYWHTYSMHSADNGKSWSPAKKLAVKSRIGRGPVKNKCITLKNGTILAPASSEAGRWKPFVDISLDQGKTWTKSKYVPAEAGLDIIQPTLWSSGNGNVHMLLRSNCGRICRSDSTDSGYTWSKARKIELLNNNSGIDMVKLKDGKLVLAYNPVNQNWGRRSPLSLAVSKNNGDSWEKIIDIESEGLTDNSAALSHQTEFSYPAIIAASDGGVAGTYTYKRKNIVFFKLQQEQLEKLTQQSKGETYETSLAKASVHIS